MMLADAGASVIRIDRTSGGQDMLARRKSSLVVDLKDPSGIALIKNLVATAQVDVIIDPFRPGVLEKLGLGPDVLLAANPRLIYGRMTGYRRDGKYSAMAGHDINYLSVSGALSMLGRAGQKPHPPINILGDFAGGGAVLFQGILLALLARGTTGKGQVVEANMVDGASYLTTFPRMGLKTPMGDKPRGENSLDGGCPWYDTYETKDGKYISVGALEPQFFAELIRLLDLTKDGWDDKRDDEANWPELKNIFESKFKSRTRSEWEAVFLGTDACVAPVLEYGELETDPSREGDQRPSVTLRDTPCYAVDTKSGDPATSGQGESLEGKGYYPTFLAPGEGGDEVLRQWTAWKKDKDYTIGDKGALWAGQKSKL